MKRSLLAALLGAPLVIAAALIGCGPPNDKDPSASTADKDHGSPTAPPVVKADLKPVEGKAGTVLKGRVTLKGKAPDVAGLTQQLQGEIQKKTDQKATCFDMAPDAEKSQQVWRLGKDNGVGNVVVWIQPPEGSYFKIDPAKLPKNLLDPVELTQPHCAFIPHVSWVMPMVLNDDPKKPVPSGQKFQVSNTAAVSHNTKWQGGPNDDGLPPLEPNKPPHEVKLTGKDQPVHFQCNIHPWMDAWVLVFNHPYVAVTDEDGNYKIENVPAGSKVRVTAWHEKGPYSNFLTPSKSKGDDFDLKDGDNVKDFEIEVKE